MQKITFKTASTTITLTDDNKSSVDNVHLVDFDGNSASVTYDTSDRVGQHGQGVYGAKFNPRTIAITIAYLSKMGVNGMYNLRRKILESFPLMTEGTLTYTTGDKVYEIDCYLAEYPNIERQVGTLCQAKIYLTAYNPFWRVNAGVWEKTYDYNSNGKLLTPIEINTTYEVPIKYTITCTQKVTSGGFFVHFDRPDDYNVHRNYFSDLEAGEKITVDWGIGGKFYCSNPSRMDFIRSVKFAALPPTQFKNNILVKFYADAGEIKLSVDRYEYVGGI